MVVGSFLRCCQQSHKVLEWKGPLGDLLVQSLTLQMENWGRQAGRNHFLSLYKHDVMFSLSSSSCHSILQMKPLRQAEQWALPKAPRSVVVELNLGTWFLFSVCSDSQGTRLCPHFRKTHFVKIKKFPKIQQNLLSCRNCRHCDEGTSQGFSSVWLWHMEE